MKIARVTALFKGGEISDLGKYGPIFAFKHLFNNNILHKKKFGFQKNHSTDHAIIQLALHKKMKFSSKDFFSKCD